MSDEILHSIEKRLERIENKLFNGWKCKAHSGLCAKVSIILGINTALFLAVVGRFIYDHLA